MLVLAVGTTISVGITSSALHTKENGVYQQRVAGAYNKYTIVVRFQEAGLLLRKAFQSTISAIYGKLATKWKEPYLIELEAGKGAFRLLTMEGVPVPRSWNVIHLKKYFI